MCTLLLYFHLTFLSFFFYAPRGSNSVSIIIGSNTCGDSKSLVVTLPIFGYRIGPVYLPFARNVWNQILLVI